MILIGSLCHAVAALSWLLGASFRMSFSVHNFPEEVAPPANQTCLLASTIWFWKRSLDWNAPENFDWALLLFLFLR